MVYSRFLLTKLISIYISLFLVFSPLQAQSEGRAKLYTRTGRLVEGKIVKIEEHSIIFGELLNTGTLREQKVPNSMIYKLISPSGEVLIENVAFESEFKSNVELFPERIEENRFLRTKKRNAEVMETMIINPQYEKITSVLIKGGREIKFYANSGQYNSEERTISGISKKRGPSNTWREGDYVTISLDDVVWVEVEKIEPGITTFPKVLVPVILLVLFIMSFEASAPSASLF